MKLRHALFCILLVLLVLPFAAAAQNNDSYRQSGNKTWPLFQGQTDETFAAWIAEQYTAPAPESLENPDKRLVIKFRVDEEGRVKSIEEMETPGEALMAQITGIMEKSPAWTPAVEGDKAVYTSYWLLIEPPYTDVRLVSRRTGKFIPPVFKGNGDVNAFRDWVMSKNSYPQSAGSKGLDGKVTVWFVVDEQGGVEVTETKSSADKSFVKKTVKTIEKSPKWTPGTLEGIPVRTYYTIAINYVQPY